MSNSENNESRSDRLPPASLEAERGVLGCVFIEPQRSLADCIERLPAGGKCFYDLRHQELYDLVVEMYHAGEAIDVLTVQQRLTDKGRLEAIGGLDFLVSLPEATPSALNLIYYLDIVREKYALRSLLRACGQVVEKVHDPEQNEKAAQLLEEAERLMLAVQDVREESSLVTAKEGGKKLLRVFDSYVRGVGIPGGLKTGLHYYDKLLGGMFPQEYAVLAGRPGSGKTSFALQILECIAMMQGLPVALFSLEMTIEQVVLRWACQRGKVNLQKFRTGYMENRDFQKLTNAAIELSKAPIWLDDRSGMTVHEIRSKARRLVREHGVRFICIDYLQLIRSADPRLVREQQVAEISAELLAMAKELEVPVLVLAQLNRQSESSDRGNHGPKLSDLRESGSVEQDAHNVTILWSPKPKTDEEEAKLEEWQQQYGGRDWSDVVQWVRARICKNRNGPTGDCNLLFLKSHMYFTDPNAP